MKSPADFYKIDLAVNEYYRLRGQKNKVYKLTKVTGYGYNFIHVGTGRKLFKINLRSDDGKCFNIPCSIWFEKIKDYENK